MNEEEQIIILFSGGYDSTLLVELALAIDLVPYCILFDYGQKHIAELKYAERACKMYVVEYTILKIPMEVRSKLTDGGAAYEGVSEWHVPARNLVFISHAASIAESMGIGRIWYGANYEDREHLFPDCYQEWVYKLNRLLEINGSKKIIVEAPLLGMTKETIRGIAGKVFNIDESKIFSGYGDA